MNRLWTCLRNSRCHARAARYWVLVVPPINFAAPCASSALFSSSR
ncbi:hypothetical protein [Ornithinimicrobium kibberense]